MPTLLRTFGLLCLVALSACTPGEAVKDQSSAVVGTRSYIKMHGQDMVSEVVEVLGRQVTTVFRDWRGAKVREVSLYRGLFPMGGSDQGLRYDMQFERDAIESLFPLEPQKSIGVSGKVHYIDAGESAEFWAHIEVVEEMTMSLKGGPRRAFVVEIEWEFDWNGIKRRKTDTLYFDAEKDLILKSVIRGENYQNYWVVIAVDEPDVPTSTPPQPIRRRAGTVSI